ncbi:glycoside hydrolase family 99-like domain-containing protein [Methanobacterium oryzae]|uniref:glycoside hydrolase family 99-like domain-containing protein n=1 Tax=Methanobacterium oryzae TaxID=69540 RepID=UPI003D2184AA
MNRLWNNVILPIIEQINANYIVEIGSDTGINTQNILEYCKKYDAHMSAIDPFPKFDIDEYKAKYGDRFEIYKDLSLSRLPLLEDYDVILLDGDHNWYTVYNELKIIEKSFKGKKFPVVFLHDISWPYGRRDLYYNHENIPDAYKQPIKKAGIYFGQTDLVKDRGLNSQQYHSIYENNPKNGILTALEDFINESDLEFSFEHINAFHGLGILYPKNTIEDIVKNIIRTASIGDGLEEERVKLIIECTELKGKANFFENRLNENKTKLEQIKIELKESNELIKESNELIKEKDSQIDDLKARFYQLQYSNSNKSISKKLISMFPSLYILFNRNNNSLKNALLNIKGYKAIKKNELLDIGYYLKNYTDIRVSGVDPILHYIYHGFKEGRDPNPSFDINYYLNANADVRNSNLNPLIHYSLYGIKEGRKTRNKPNTLTNAMNNSGVSSKLSDTDNDFKTQYITNLVHNAFNKSNDFVEYQPDFKIDLKEDDIKLIAFYLPQFHPFPQNDEWWGKGFTEWTNVTKAVPLFAGHYQPHLPIDLGFYDLRLIETQKRQIELAKQYGLFGFCYHYYWFNGTKLMETPIKTLLENPEELDFPFCICWANENWTRRWDGNEDDILIAQDYTPEDDLEIIKDLSKYFKDKRYIKINNKPLIMVYKPQLLPNPKETFSIWREYCKNEGIGELYIVGAKRHDFADPESYGMDAAVEFPPNTPQPEEHKENIKFLNNAYHPPVYDVEKFINDKQYMGGEENYKTFKTVFPSWDNTPRRFNDGQVYLGNPELYEKWLNNVIEFTKETMDETEQFVFINAWNEWAEGAHLEPDRKYGYAYLKATANAILKSKNQQLMQTYPLKSTKETNSILNALNPDKKISVIITIYNAYDDTKKCIYSVLENTSIPYELILIDDCSSDERIGILLDEMEKIPHLKVIRNSENRGYTKNINVGIENSEGDVVLLNSDTIVTPKWLQKLVVAAYSNERIGTVTPLTNASTISIPEMGVDNPIPEGLTINDMATLVEKVSSDITVEAPTTNGFCMFIKRETINDIGLFDEKNFGRGYGEENDFCMRATYKNWINIYDDSIFIYHKRSASFSSEKDVLKGKNQHTLEKIHPTYTKQANEFLTSSKLKIISNNIKSALDKGEIEKICKKRILYVVHSGGGGTQYTNEDLMKHIQKDLDCYILSSNADEVVLSRFINNEYKEIYSWTVKSKWSAKDFHNQEFKNIYFNVINGLKIDIVHVRHLIQHTFDLVDVTERLGIPTILSFHDFYFICPSFNLLDDKISYCEGKCTDGKGQCHISHKALEDLPQLKTFINTWRDEVSSILDKSSAFVTTSDIVKQIFISIYPQLLNKEFKVIEHGRDFKSIKRSKMNEIPSKNKPVKILIPGDIRIQKGGNFIKALQKEDKNNRLEFHFMGSLQDNLEKYGTYHGPYTRENFCKIVKNVEPSFIGIFSIWPETYCHTLSEAWSCDVPVLASKIGVLEERVNKNGGGWLLDFENPSAAYKEIIRIIESGEEYIKVAEQAKEITFRSTNEMADEYLNLYSKLLQENLNYNYDVLISGNIKKAIAK